VATAFRAKANGAATDESGEIRSEHASMLRPQLLSSDVRWNPSLATILKVARAFHVTHIAVRRTHTKNICR
jgi:hypothetical protein